MTSRRTLTWQSTVDELTARKENFRRKGSVSFSDHVRVKNSNKDEVRKEPALYLIRSLCPVSVAADFVVDVFQLAHTDIFEFP